MRLKHCYILLSGLIVFARCGSTPSVDPAADAEGDIPISDVADVETGIDGGMDASELFDHGDGSPTDVEDDLNDVEDGSVRPDIADVGTPEVTNCGDLGVICFVDDQAATSPIEVVFDPAGTEWPLCRLMGATNTDTVAWDLHFADGAVASLEEMPGMQRVEVVSTRTGEAQLIASLQACVVDGPTIQFRPGELGLTIELVWAAATTSFNAEADLDLHVLRSANACWGDPANDFHFRSPRTLPWGDPRSLADDPFRSQDVATVPGVEYVTAQGVSADEVWVVVAEVRNLSPSEGVRATASIFRDGVVEFRGELVPDSIGFWVIANVAFDSTSPIDSFRSEAPGCDAPVECDDRPASVEMCNGIDDDCDGDVDEYPETCVNEFGRPTDAACVFLSPAVEMPYRCVEL